MFGGPWGAPAVPCTVEMVRVGHPERARGLLWEWGTKPVRPGVPSTEGVCRTYYLQVGLAPIEVGNALRTVQCVDVTWVELALHDEVEKYVQPNDPWVDRCQT